jgi:single-stranded-DNA-specific exonuclease
MSIFVLFSGCPRNQTEEKIKLKDEQSLLLKAQNFGTKISNSAKKQENILILHHYDGDGCCAGSLLAQFIFKNKGHCQARPATEPNVKNIERLGQAKFDLVIFLDVGSGISSDVNKYLGDKWLIIDHHFIPEEETNAELEERILNPWQFGFDGTKDISASGLVYLLSEKARSESSAFLALVGALADSQDVGPKKSFVGLNARIVTDARESAGLDDSRVDLLFYGRDVRPIHESLASTVSFFLPGLTGNKDACLALLRGAGLDLKIGQRWKTVTDLSEEEKQQVLGAILPHLSGTTLTAEDLVGTVYCRDSTDEFSPLHDARDLAAVLSACGRMGKSGTAVSMSIGTNPDLINEAEKTFAEYRTELVREVQILGASAERTLDRALYTIILGDGILGETMTGAACQVFARFNRFKNRIVFVRTTTQEGEVKVSARQGRGAEADIGLLMSYVAKATNGVGGGLSNSGGAKFSIAKQQEFQTVVEAQFQTLKTK